MLASLRRVIGARSDLQHLADRLDSELVTMLVDVVDDHFDGRSSSAAKKADAERKISFAAAQLTVLLLELLDPSRVLARQPRLRALIDVGLT